MSATSLFIEKRVLVTRVFTQYVDVNTTVLPDQQTGSEAFPFDDWQPALDKTVVSPAGVITVNLIHMSQGTYDTGVDYTYDPTNKRTKTITHGPVRIGTYGGFGLLAAQDPRRNIILAGSASSNEDDVRCYFAIVAGEESSGNPRGTVQNSFNKMRITGKIDMSAVTQVEFGNFEITLVGVEIDGTDGTPTGVSIDMGSNNINGTVEFDQCSMFGQILLGNDTRLDRVNRTKIGGLIVCESMNLWIESTAKGGMTFHDPSTFSNTFPNAMHISTFEGEFSGAAIAGSVIAVDDNGSGQARFTTAADHGLATGQAVTHTGFTEGTYNVVDAVIVVISVTEYDIVAIAIAGTDTGTLASTVITTLFLDKYTDNSFVANGATLDVNAIKTVIGV